MLLLLARLIKLGSRAQTLKRRNLAYTKNERRRINVHKNERRRLSVEIKRTENMRTQNQRTQNQRTLKGAKNMRTLNIYKCEKIRIKIWDFSPLY